MIKGRSRVPGALLDDEMMNEFSDDELLNR